MYKSYKIILLVGASFFSNGLIGAAQLERKCKKSLKRPAPFDCGSDVAVGIASKQVIPSRISKNYFADKEAFFARYASERKKREDAGTAFHPFGIDPAIYFPKKIQKSKEVDSK